MAHPLLLQATDTATKSSSNQKVSGFSAYGMWILIVVMVVVFYFLLIRPQRKRSQEHDSMVQSLNRGDEVVTIGGMHGTIKKISDDTVTLEVDKGVRITFAKSAISRSLTQPEPEEEEEEEEAVEEPEEEETLEETEEEEETSETTGEEENQE